MTIEERVSKLEIDLRTLAKASNYMFPDDEWAFTPIKKELADYKEELRARYAKKYPEGDYLFEDFLLERLYLLEKK